MMDRTIRYSCPGKTEASDLPFGICPLSPSFQVMAKLQPSVETNGASDWSGCLPHSRTLQLWDLRDERTPSETDVEKQPCNEIDHWALCPQPGGRCEQSTGHWRRTQAGAGHEPLSKDLPPHTQPHFT